MFVITGAATRFPLYRCGPEREAMYVDSRTLAERASGVSSCAARMNAARQALQARRSSGRMRAQMRIAAERPSRASDRAVAARPCQARGARTRTADQPRDPAAEAVRPRAAAPSNAATPIRTMPSRPSFAAKCSTAQNVRAPVCAVPRASATAARPPAAAGTPTTRNGARCLCSGRVRGGRSRSSAPTPSAAKPRTNSPAPTVTGEEAMRTPPPRRAERRRRGGRWASRRRDVHGAAPLLRDRGHG